MKPLSLTMSALGPYARETRISFEDVSQGLFLITGETGSGKTMIFDAIMFALYDDSSGTSRGSGSLRSDFAPPDQETFVELEFLLRSQRYRIRRSPRYQRPRLRGQGMTEQAATVELSLPDGRVMTSKREVDASLVDLIGLDKDQFRQVAMIAQGAFFDLIEASSLERSRIYRRLFNTWIYQDLEGRLLAAFSAARTNLTTSSSQLFMDLKRFSFPDWAQDLAQEARDLVAAKDIWAVDTFLESLEGLAENFKDKREAIDQRLEVARARLSESQARLDKIRQANQCLDQLEKAKGAAAQLEAQGQAHEADIAKLDAADRAARLVTAPYREWQQAKKSLEALEGDLEEERLSLDQAQAAYRKALDQSRQVSDQEAQLQALPGQMTALEKEMADLDKAMGLEDEMAGLDRRLQDKQEALTQLETRRQDLEARLVQEEERLAALAQVDSLLLEREREADKLGARREDLTRIQADLEGLEGSLEALTHDRARLEEDLKAWRAEDEKASQAQEALYRERAGLLARDLEEGLPCPVCGSLHHPDKAVLSPQAPSREEVDRLLEEAESSRQAVDGFSRSLEVKEAGIKADFKGLLVHAQALLVEDLPDQPDLADRMKTLRLALLAASDRILTACRLAEEALGLARQQRDERDQLLARIKAQKADLAAQVPEKESLEEAMGALKLDKARFKGEWDSLQGGLSGKDQAQLKTDLQAMSQAYEALKEAGEKARLEEDRAGKTLAGVQASLRGLEKQRGVLDLEAKRLEAGFFQAAEGAGFESLDAYLSSVLEEEERLRLQARVVEERSARADLARDIQRLTRESQGLVRQDEALEGQAFLEGETGLRSLEEEADRLKMQAALTQTSLEAVRQSFLSAVQAREEESLLKDLADLASGKHREADQVSFETYVQTWYFAQVIRQANQRLGQMTGGRYSLRRTEEAESRRARTGLDLSVEDHWNAKIRSVSSLSGGEKFQTVLALALGLSDVVMAHAGGVEINSLFIDEGFGSLDEHSLQEAMAVLQGLAEDNRMIGIISHLGLLTQAVDRQLQVKKGDRGSSLTWA